VNPVWSLFPKAYREMDARRLAGLVRDVGLDTTNVVIRKGYVVEEETVVTSLPRFVNEARKEGIVVNCASTTLSTEQITMLDSMLSVFADCGVREFRMGWFPKADTDIRGAIQRAKGEMDRVVEACERHRVRAIYQVHHNTLITSASAAFNLIKGLPSAWVGIELDPGNQSFQGYEPWHFAVGLLGEYCAWVGVKDTITWRDPSLKDDPDKGWRRTFAPLQEGVTNWSRLIDALDDNDFDGTLVFMPFYEENDEKARTTKLRSEVQYLRSLYKSTKR
jgi:sugar phosphate isomerase/epimerase